MSYQLIKVPEDIKQDISCMNQDEVSRYFEWFSSVKDKRLSYLLKIVIDGNILKINIDELNEIQEYVSNNLKVRKKTEEEIYIEGEILPQSIKSIHKVKEYEFVEPTMSILFDISIYLGELLCKEVEGVSWSFEQEKEMAYYGYPILVKKGIKKSFCPLWVLEMLAIKIYEGNANSKRLLELYNTNKKVFLGVRKNYNAMIDAWSKKK